MDVYYEFVVYKLNNLLGNENENHKVLEKVEFGNTTANSFDSEYRATQALIESGKTYENFVILKQVYIRNY